VDKDPLTPPPHMLMTDKDSAHVKHFGVGVPSVEGWGGLYWWSGLDEST